MKLTQDVYLVGGGDYGFNLTHRLDCHVYVVDGGSELALIDAGFGPGTEEILALMKEDGLDPDRLAAPALAHEPERLAAEDRQVDVLDGREKRALLGQETRLDRVELRQTVDL